MVVFVKFIIADCDPHPLLHDGVVLVNPNEVVAVTQRETSSYFVSLRMSSGERLHVTGVRSEILDKLGIVVR